jgi:beta-glucosidase
VRAAHHLLLGHGLAVEAIRAQGGARPDLGITLNLFPVSPASGSPADEDAARRVDGLANRLFLDPVLKGRYPSDVTLDLAPVTGWDHVRDGDERQITQPLEFLGINYYQRHVCAAGEARLPSAWVGSEHVRFVGRGLPRTKMGWEIEPSGLYDVASRVARDYPGVPLYITENGAAFDDVVSPDGSVHDQYRISYIDGHVRALHRAITDGIDLRGYFLWTLMDNFEWAFGFDRRFGLVHVDHATQRRTLKDSARWFAELAGSNRLPWPSSPPDRSR